MSKFTAIVLAGGSGKRMQSDIPKQYMMLGDKPMLAYSLIAFEESGVDDVVIVCRLGDEEYIRKDFVEKFNLQKVSAIVHGGEERFDSVFEGIKACGNTDYVLIHDGARPYISKDIIENNISGVLEYNAVVTAVASTDTIKIANSDKTVKNTPDRSTCYSIQTPQSFRIDIIKEAFTKFYEAKKQGRLSVSITDDSMLVEEFTDYPVRIIDGEYTNIKITNPSDIK